MHSNKHGPQCTVHVNVLLRVIAMRGVRMRALGRPTFELRATEVGPLTFNRLYLENEGPGCKTLKRLFYFYWHGNSANFNVYHYITIIPLFK